MTACVSSSTIPPPLEMIPRKLTEDDDDDDHPKITGGPFENAKRKSSWSATTMRKELGSPRMATHNNNSTAATPVFRFEAIDSNTTATGFDPPSHIHTTATNSSCTAVLTQNVVVASAFPKRPSEIPPRISNSVHNKRDRFCARTSGASFLQELGSALVSCGGGNDRHKGGNNKLQSSESRTGDLMNASASWVLLKDSILKVVRGDLGAAKEAWRRSIDTTNTTTDEYSYLPASVNSAGSHDSMVTYDYCKRNQKQLLQQEEEAMQLRRLTSWGTVGTYETIETAGTITNLQTANAKSNCSITGTSQNQGDASSNVIKHPSTDNSNTDSKTSAVQQLSQVHATPAAKTRRKRVVRFDYPPISSLRECPRTQPEQIRDLFFTEHELEQIEDDRYSTISADDVEIVAISTSSTAESDSNNGSHSIADDNNNNNNSKSPFYVSSPRHSLSKNSSEFELSHFRNCMATRAVNSGKHSNTNKKDTTPKKHRLRNFSFDDMVNGSRTNSSQQESYPVPSKKSEARRSRQSPASEASSSSSTNTGLDTNAESSSPAASSRRMIKSVQIYLRERSVG